MRRILTLLALLAAPGLAAQPVTGLSGWSVVIDPGHSFTQNQGVFGYSEAEKVLAVGLELRRLLSETTDIDTVYMTRTRGDIEVSLTERTTYANQVGASYFHSIHSDAGSATANSTLIMYGGWRQNGQTVEKTPHGGREMSEHMDRILTAAMRIGRRGAYADRTFYEGFPENHSRFYPYLHVNRETAMASTLSEAGFHTNVVQNQRNMNADWKRLEARALYWSMLAFHGVERPAAHIVTGIVRDIESGEPVNGATVDIAGASYTTDTYASLFNRFSNDPELLRNGFYYLEDLPAGQQQVTVTSEGYEPFTTTVTPVDTFFTFLDMGIVSNALPVIATSLPAAGQEGFRVIDPIDLTFSRPMDRASVEAAFEISPEVEGSFVWTQGDRRLTFRPDSLAPFTTYTVTIGAGAESPFGYDLDGNRDGTAGDAFVLTFTTGAPDVVAPRVVAARPSPNETGVDRLPVITVIFSELLDTTSVTEALFVLEPNGGGTSIAKSFQVENVGDQTVVAFSPVEALDANAFYRVRVQAGLKDVAGNASTSPQSFTFRTREALDQITAIESFEGNFTNNWWEPAQSGSTTNINTDSTRRRAENVIVNPQGGSQAMALFYGWMVGESGSFLLREYLGGGAPLNVTFDKNHRIQAYVFGDGSGTLFRFALDDLPSQHEVSPWYKVDWKGWKLVEWDIANEAPGTWLGDGVVDGNLRFDSFQLSYDGGAAFGKIVIDDLRLAKAITTSTEEEVTVPVAVTLDGNLPNPFHEQTTVVFSVPTAMAVTLRVFDLLGREVAALAESTPFAAGTHRLEWAAQGLSSGTYLLRLEAGGHVETRSVTLLR